MKNGHQQSDTSDESSNEIIPQTPPDQTRHHRCQPDQLHTHVHQQTPNPTLTNFTQSVVELFGCQTELNKST